ncbi:MAG: hypothetical protein KC415_08995 [Anaerolineales bacterium]|nr:hypothetical protein [Anaerolineales bacterium]MCB8991066.1 hypothetical protein [Ardenticatenaceae bacterium]MCB9004108.1 hypothetical protein [Ardenticatenaceae bacterium]
MNLTRYLLFLLTIALFAGCATQTATPAATSAPTPIADATEMATAVPTPPAEVTPTIIPLHGSISANNSELSGLAWYGDTLILLPQYPNRLNNNLYALSKADILAFLNGETTDALTPQPIPLLDDGVRNIHNFEGYEAIAFLGDQVFATIESSPGIHMMGYLVNGRIAPDLSAITLNIPGAVEIAPQADISNYTDETVFIDGDTVMTLYEANGQNVNATPQAHRFDMALNEQPPLSFPNIEYRITDATAVDGNGRFWAINYNYPGDKLDIAADPLAAQFGSGPTHAASSIVERLVEFQIGDNGITFSGTPPIQLALLENGDARNWEGIVRLDDRGFLLVTDKFPETILAFVSK